MILSPNELAYVAKEHWADKGSFNLTLADGTNRVTSHWEMSVAVGLGESGGDTLAMHRSTSGVAEGNRDHGVYQVSNYWHQLRGDGTPGRLLMAGDLWRDPYVNAQMAFEIWYTEQKAGRDPWRPWHVYTSKSCFQYLKDAAIAVKAPWAPPDYQADLISEFKTQIATVINAVNKQRTISLSGGFTGTAK